MGLNVAIFAVVANDGTETTWLRAEDEAGNVVESRELFDEEIAGGTVRLQMLSTSAEFRSLSAEWYDWKGST